MGRKTKAQAAQTRQEIIDAARRVFHENGVSRTSMESVAKAAGVTRGAIYWHFENKAALFYAMREEAMQVLEETRAWLAEQDIYNPLDAIERSLLILFDTLENHPAVRQSFEIMMLRCEYVDEFTPVLQEVIRPNKEYLLCLKARYQEAQDKGLLRPAQDCEALAYDTLAFTSGLFKNWLSSPPGESWRTQTRQIIRTHLDLRRKL